MLRTLLLPVIVIGAPAVAQTIVPFVTSAERFGVFHDGRFVELEPRKPTAVFPNGDRLMYLSAEGELRGFIDGHTVNLQRGEQVDVKTSRGMFAWKQGEVLRVLKGMEPLRMTYDAGKFDVRDSMVVYHDEVQYTLNVYWRGQVIPVADVLLDADATQWQSGTNTLTFYDRDARQVILFHRGASQILCENVDVARVSTGGDIVAYMDDSDDTFKAFDHGDRVDLEPFAPVSFNAGLGIIGYVSATDALRAYVDHRVYSLEETAPTAYYVQDSVITWVDAGTWKTLNDGRVEVVERFVPENWQVYGAHIVYQDLNRELRMYHRGQRTVITREAGVKRFELHGDAVVWMSNSGTVKVWWEGKVYERY